MSITIKRSKNESKDELIGKFRRVFLEENITDEIKKRVAYSKPSEKRYEKKKIAIWRKKCRRRAKKARNRTR